MDRLSVSRTLARSWQVYWSRLGVFVTIRAAMALITVGVVLLAAWAMTDLRSDFEWFMAISGGVLAGIGLVVVEFILVLVYIQVAFGQIADLKWSSVALVRSVSLSSLPRVIGITVCLLVLGFIPFLLFVLFVGLANLDGMSWLLGVFVLPLAVMWMLAPVVAIADNARVLTSLGRSWRLVSPHFWTVLLISLIPGLVVTLPRAIVPQIPELFWTVFDGIFLPPYSAVLTTVLYVELKRQAGTLQFDVIVARLFGSNR